MKPIKYVLVLCSASLVTRPCPPPSWTSTLPAPAPIPVLPIAGDAHYTAKTADKYSASSFLQLDSDEDWWRHLSRVERTSSVLHGTTMPFILYLHHQSKWFLKQKQFEMIQDSVFWLSITRTVRRCVSYSQSMVWYWWPATTQQIQQEIRWFFSFFDFREIIFITFLDRTSLYDVKYCMDKFTLSSSWCKSRHSKSIFYWTGFPKHSTWSFTRTC